MNDQICIFIVGPTAVGKSCIAFEIAKHYNTEIISADSRQCFKELNIGVAKPELTYLKEISHYFINSHSITDNVSVANFRDYATDKLVHVYKISNKCIVVGGTGFYINSLIYGLNEVPEIVPEIRNQINENVKLEGIKWLQHEIKKYDPEFYAQSDINNRHRMQRALEVIKSSGKSILCFSYDKKIKEKLNYIIFGIDENRDVLYKKINERVDIMIKSGLIDEAKELFEKKLIQNRKIIGYSELEDFFMHKVSVEQAVEKIKQNTRNYAKRQMTWFKKMREIKWFSPKDLKSIIATIDLHLNKVTI